MAVPGSQNNDTLNDMAWKPDASCGLLVGSHGTVLVVNGTTTLEVSGGTNYTLSRIAWRPDGSYALIVGEGGTILKFVSVKLGLEHIDSHTSVNLQEVAWKPDGTYALITGADGVMLRFDHDSQRCLVIQTHTSNRLGDICWDTNGEHAEIRTDNGTTLTYPPAVPLVPKLEVLAPADGATVSGAFTMEGAASAEGAGISGVEVQFDSGAWAVTEGTEHWRLNVDASSMSDGFHRLRIRAWSLDGSSAEVGLGINVANPVLPPEVRILSPADGASLSGMVDVVGTSSSHSGQVERVDVRLDGNDWMALRGIESWHVTLDTTTFSNGVHRIQARAWDGRSCTVTTITVTMSNQRPSETVPEPAAASTPPPSGTNQARRTLSEVSDDSSSSDLAGPDEAPVPVAALPEGTADGGTIKVPMLSGGILLLAGLALATEQGKYALFQFLFVPLYSRIKKDRVLDNFTRGMIYGFIMSNPGVHYNFIKQKLGLNNGSIVYHLTVLERQELIKSERVGLYKRFYPVNGTLNESGIMELNDEQSRLLELVRGRPGMTQHDVAEAMGLSGRVVNYHIGLLQRSRLVTIEKDGRVARLYATERMPVC